MRVDKATSEIGLADQFDTVVVNEILDVAQDEARDKILNFLGR